MMITLFFRSVDNFDFVGVQSPLNNAFKLDKNIAKI